MSGINFRGRRRFRESPATERLTALLGEGDAPAGAEQASRHREDVLVRRRLSRPALVVLCAVLLLAVVLGSVSLAFGGEDDAVVTSAAVSGDAGRGSGASEDVTAGGAAASDREGTADDGQPGSAASGSTVAASTPSAGSTSGAQEAGVLTVHVVGEVKDPSVVTLSSGARVMDAVQAAGGFTRAAVKDRINLAQPVQDGAQITIPNAGNADRVAAEQTAAGATSPSGPAAGTGAGSGGADRSGGDTSGAAAGGGAAGVKASGGTAPGGSPVNLNTATAAELETLPRVGPVLAQRIVDFRTQHGPFTAPEQLDDVSGVGPTMLEALLPLVTV